MRYNSDYYFEMVNINNSSLPTQTVPDYPFPVEHPDFVIFDPRAGVVRACGGNIPNKENVKDSQTDKCFTFNRFEWQPMESLGNSLSLFKLKKSKKNYRIF